MPKPLTERELLQIQIQSYEFYARLIDRAVGGSSAAIMPKWDEQRAREYKLLAEELRERLAELDAREANAPATEPGEAELVSSPTSTTSNVTSVTSPSPE